MFVIRQKGNPKALKAWGYTTAPGGLGNYDPEEFEEVEVEDLPKGFELYKEPPSATGEAFRQLLLAEIKEGRINNFTEDTLADFNIALASFYPVLQQIDALNGGFKSSRQLQIYMTKFFTIFESKLKSSQKKAIQDAITKFTTTHRFVGK